MKNYLTKLSQNVTFLKVKKFALAHKVVTTGLIIIIVGGGYYEYKKATSTTGQTQYVTAIVKKQTIISTVTGSGQVSATNQLDVKAKVSGDVTWVNVKAGDKVYAGQALAGLDNRDAKAAVVDAEASLAEAKLQFQKDQAQAPIDYQKNLDNLQNAKNDLVSVYNDTFNTLSNTYLDLPNIIVGIQNTLYGYDLNISKTQVNYDAILNVFHDESLAKVQDFALKSTSDYKIARDKYDSALVIYKQISRTSSPEQLESLLAQSIDMTTATAQSLQSELNFLSTSIDIANQYSISLSSVVTTLQTNTRTRLSTVNSDLSSLLSQKKSIDTTKQSITTYEQNIELSKVGNDNGNNPISLQISQSNLNKQERNLEDLKRTLSYYTVVAPFGGTVASVSAKVGQTAATIATIVTNEQIAELSLNEVDAAKIKPGQKATLTFDAIDGLSLSGTVEEIDPVGTVSQGVVSYIAKITFDTADSRIKPGMTVNATIQTDVHTDVLTVPNSSVKTVGGVSRVQIFTPPLPETVGTSGTVSSIPPQQVEVTVGISDDNNIEIISGLTEGEQVVSRTVTGTATTATTGTTRTTTTGTRTVGGTNVIRF